MTTITRSQKHLDLLVNYCRFLLASFSNFTQTYFADHTDKWSHDQLNRLLRNDRITARDLWKTVKEDIEFDKDGYLLLTILRTYAN